MRLQLNLTFFSCGDKVDTLVGHDTHCWESTREGRKRGEKQGGEAPLPLGEAFKTDQTRLKRT